MTPMTFLAWSAVVGIGGAFAIGCIGMAVSFAWYIVGSEVVRWRR